MAAIFVFYIAKNTVISSNFLVWKFCRKTQFPYSFGADSPFLCLSTKFAHRKLGEITIFVAVLHFHFFQVKEPKNIDFDQVADDIDGVADKGDLQELSSLALAVGSVMNKNKEENTTKVCLTQYLTLIVSYFAQILFPWKWFIQRWKQIDLDVTRKPITDTESLFFHVFTVQNT